MGEVIIQDKRKWTFTIIQNVILEDKDLDPYDKTVYSLLCKFSSKDTGECYPSLNTLGSLVPCGKDKLLKSIEKLVAKGYISKENRFNQDKRSKDSNLYVVNDNPSRSERLPLVDLNDHPSRSERHKLEPINKNQFNYKYIVEYLNEKAGTKYKINTKKTADLIKARVNEGFTEEDFKIVIDKKCKEWLGTEFAQYIRPETLFGTKFEGYLNQKEKTSGPAPKKKNSFNNFDQDITEKYSGDELEKMLRNRGR